MLAIIGGSGVYNIEGLANTRWVKAESSFGEPSDEALVDDLIATGGTAEAACTLIARMGGKIVECCFIIDLPDIGGRARLEKHGHKVFALCEFEGD